MGQGHLSYWVGLKILTQDSSQVSELANIDHFFILKVSMVPLASSPPPCWKRVQSPYLRSNTHASQQLPCLLCQPFTMPRTRIVSVSCSVIVRLFEIPWTIACQAPFSIGFPRQEHWSGLSFLSPGDLPNPGIEPRSPALQVNSLRPKPPSKTQEGLDVLGLVREEGELQDLARVFQKKLTLDWILRVLFRSLEYKIEQGMIR